LVILTGVVPQTTCFEVFPEIVCQLLNADRFTILRAALQARSFAFIKIYQFCPAARLNPVYAILKLHHASPVLKREFVTQCISLEMYSNPLGKKSSIDMFSNI
jgi:hypothetical protein